MSKTKHLDTALAILKGSDTVKRPKRAAQAVLDVMAGSNAYTITSNGKLLETGQGNLTHAKARAEARAAEIRKLGKTVVINIY